MLGAIVGMGRWKGMPEVDPKILANGSVVVSVRSDALADKVTRILTESGAEGVRVRAEGERFET